MENIDSERELLLKHARKPLRVGEIAEAHGRGQCHNPLCGDKISVSFLTEGNVLKEIKIQPSGCSISLASASLMTEMVEGRNLSEIEAFIDIVNENFSPKNAHNAWPTRLYLLSPLKRIRENPLKIPCVLICWIAMKEALKTYKSSTIH